MAQTWAEVRSDVPSLNGLHTVVGKVKPGETAERCLATIIPHDAPTGEVVSELVFHAAGGHAPPRPLVFTILPLPRPDFSVSWRVVNDGSGNSFGSGDGRPKRGEYVDLVVTVDNQTGESFSGLDLTLISLDRPAGVHVTGDRSGLGAVADGATAEGRLHVRIDRDAQRGVATFELRVGTEEGRTFAVEPVRFEIA